MRNSSAGFTLVEALAVLLVVGLVAASIGGVFATTQRIGIEQDLEISLEQNLRASMGMITDVLRLAGCGVPTSHISDWISWAGTVGAPVQLTDGGTGPDTVSVAFCTPPLATLASDVNAGSTSLSLNGAFPGHALSEFVDTSDMSLLWISDSQYARVVGISGNDLTIDTDPTSAGNQGLLRNFRTGTPVARIDFFTFQIASDSLRQRSWLEIDKHRGSPVQAAEGINDLQVAVVSPGSYRITLSGQTEGNDPRTGTPITRTISDEVTVRN